MIADHFRLTAQQKTALSRLGLATEEDLLRYFPNRYEAPAHECLIRDLRVGETVRITGEITAVKIGRGFRTKLPIGEVTITDTTGQIRAVWFHQVYLAKKVPVGGLCSLRGKVAKRPDKGKAQRGELYLTNPELEPLERLPDPGGSLFTGEKADGQSSLLPIYPETRGLSSNWFYHAIKKLLRSDFFPTIVDPIPKEILTRYHLPALSTALVWIHAPRRAADATVARKRFAFEEIFLIQLDRLRRRVTYQNQISHRLNVPPPEIASFIKRLPFSLTAAQARAIKDILKDLDNEKPMARLLEGDVGSGKTSAF